MAVQKMLVDDLNGSTHDVQTVKFSVNGTRYSIDLGPEHRAELEESLAPFISVATIVGSTTSNAKEIRAWAQENGYEVSDRGAISAEVREAYNEAVELPPVM